MRLRPASIKLVAKRENRFESKATQKARVRGLFLALYATAAEAWRVVFWPPHILECDRRFREQEEQTQELGIE
jgi:hypothetical protein